MSFNEYFRNAVRQGIAGAIGNRPLLAFLYTSNLDLETATPRDVHLALIAVFMEDGSKILEKAICQRLCAMTGILYKNNRTFETIIRESKLLYEATH